MVALLQPKSTSNAIEQVDGAATISFLLRFSMVHRRSSELLDQWVIYLGECHRRLRGDRGYQGHAQESQNPSNRQWLSHTAIAKLVSTVKNTTPHWC